MKDLLRNIFRSSYYTLYGKSGKKIMINQKEYTVSAHIARGVKSEIHEVPLSIFINLSRNANTVFDIGANVGIIATLVSKEMKPGSAMYSFEPAPLTFKYLADTARVQQGNAKITACNLAISNSTGKLYFTNDGNSCTNHIANENDGNTVAVEAVTLDSFCKQNNVVPDVMKVDIEGAEYWALEGMQQVLKNNNCIVLMEIHSRFLKENNITGKMFADIIDNAGYKVFDADGKEVKNTDILDIALIVIAREKPAHAFVNIG